MYRNNLMTSYAGTIYTLAHSVNQLTDSAINRHKALLQCWAIGAESLQMIGHRLLTTKRRRSVCRKSVERRH